jgi:protein TonB
MGCFENSTQLVHGSSWPTAERLLARKQTGVAPLPHGRREKTGSESRDEEDLIFHGLIASGEQPLLRNRWATIGSLMFQSALLGMVAMIPLLQLHPLPEKLEQTAIYLPPPKIVAPVAPRIETQKPAFSPVPRRSALPVPVQISREQTAPPVNANSDTPIEIGGGGTPDGSVTGILGAPPRTPVLAKPPEPPPVKRIRVSAHVAEANLIHDVQPQYPPEAGRERIEGRVVLLAVIGTDGTVKDLRLESGPSVLAQAAIDAVKQWRYKPYLLNGSPVEIDSRITINFTMSRG